MKTKKVRRSKSFKVVICCFSLLVLALIFFQLRAKSTVASFLERKIPSHITLNYDGLNVNLLLGRIQFSQVDLKIRDRDTTLNHTLIDVKEVTVAGLSYWQFFLKNTIRASELAVENPSVTYYPSKTFRDNSDKPKGVVNLLKDIVIGKVKISNGSFNMIHQQSDSAQVSARNINFSLTYGKTDPDIIQQKIPIVYDSYDFSTEEIYVDLGPFETVKASALTITETNAKLTDLRLQSKYSKKELSNVITKERDHIDLKVPEFSLKNIDFGFEENRFFFNTQFGEIENLDLNLYRDKLVADDRTVKRMYSAVLRELPIHLKIDSMALTNSKIKYEEKVKGDAKAGNLFFDKMNLKLKNIGNTYSEGNLTTANLKGKLMGIAPLTVNYSFDVNDKNDAFTMATTLSGLHGEHINSFLRPNLNARIKGEVIEQYCTISGNRFAARGDMKMKYKNLKFQVLQKDRLKINKLLSAIGNLFINDGSDSDAQGYRYGSIDVKRDPTKSLFNYVWVSTQDGLMSTLTGNGRKKED